LVVGRNAAAFGQNEQIMHAQAAQADFGRFLLRAHKKQQVLRPPQRAQDDKCIAGPYSGKPQRMSRHDYFQITGYHPFSSFS
jgi:hypothetical protein